MVNTSSCLLFPPVCVSGSQNHCLPRSVPPLRLCRHPPSPNICVEHLLQRELKAPFCILCHHSLFNNYPNKVNNMAHGATPRYHHGPPQPSSSGLMNGAIRHASCPGGEQAAPAGQPGHQARGRKSSRASEGRAGRSCQDSH